jgi:hypothetical protein
METVQIYDNHIMEEAKMAQAIINQQGNEVAIQTSYDADFVSELKAKINYTDRRWDGASKSWIVIEAEADKVIEIASRFFDVIDARGKSGTEVEAAQIEAEIAQIKANQQYILEHEARIVEIIDALTGKIERFSHRSKSNIRYSLAQDRALLQHSLDNAHAPVEQLTELQVKGLAAAVRLLSASQTPRYWPFGWNFK